MNGVIKLHESLLRMQKYKIKVDLLPQSLQYKTH